jgi:hypothetical protein
VSEWVCRTANRFLTVAAPWNRVHAIALWALGRWGVCSHWHNADWVSIPPGDKLSPVYQTAKSVTLSHVTRPSAGGSPSRRRSPIVQWAR